MTHKQAAAAAYILAAIVTITGAGIVRTTKHNAVRIHAGSYRLHVDADEVTVWRAGGPATLVSVKVAPVVVLPPVAEVATARPRADWASWRPVSAPRPRGLRYAGLTC